QSRLFEFSNDELPRFETILATIPCNPIAGFAPRQECSCVDARISIKDTDLVQAASFSDFEIIEIVPRRNLQRSSTKSPIHIRIGNDWNNSSGDRQTNILADPIPIAFVFRMNRDRGVAEHRLRASGRDDEVLSGIISQRVADVPEFSVCVYVYDFD